MGLFGLLDIVTFGLRDVKIAKRNNDGSYGTAVDVPSVQLLEASPQTINAQLEGDDTITAVHAVANRAQVRIRFGSLSVEALEVITGQTASLTGTTPNRKRTLTIDDVDFPYFGLVGKAVGAQGGDVHVFVPMLKAMEGFTATFEYGRFAVPEITAMALPDPEQNNNYSDY